MNTTAIDLNCDLGESFGSWSLGDDEHVLPHVSSANIACGFHAGDPQTMQRSVALCLQYDVAIGAQPGWPDLVGFGRRRLAATAAETYALVLYQIGALAAFAQAAGGQLSHVKPHGALYNQAARDRVLADAIANAVVDFDTGLTLYALAGSRLADAGRDAGLHVAQEAFCDRRYLADGQLQPRTEPGAVIEDPEAAASQAVSLACSGRVTTNDGQLLHLQVDTLCVHGDRPDAAVFAHTLHQRLTHAGVKIQAGEVPPRS